MICPQSRIELSGARPGGDEASPLLDAGLLSIGMLAADICGECVPRQRTRTLKKSMDQIQELARRMT